MAQGRFDMAHGRIDEAILLHERTLADRVRVLGPKHPQTLDSRNHLADAYRLVSRLDDQPSDSERSPTPEQIASIEITNSD
ncbi:MAG TPA: tetratricopeptide repeat protein [Aldersonia sp.]